ncbi:MAG: hypothetical protein NTW87_06260 [Planctomycetota bacterium]|nr:hypothetical protein [Planctomycetota bacterium]
MVYLILSIAIVVGSSVWAAIDSHLNKITSGKGEYTISNGALAWGLGCLVLWIIVFPYYLVKRYCQLRERNEGRKARVGSLVGLGCLACWVLVMAWSLTVGSRLSTSQLEGRIRDHIESTWSKEPRLSAARISSFALVHTTGNNYEGMLEYELGAERATLKVDVTYDGRIFTWKTRR